MNGCAGVSPDAGRTSLHGGNVWGVVSATYTDLGGAGGTPGLTTVDQQNVRQKLQQVEFALNQSGTNTGTTPTRTAAASTAGASPPVTGSRSTGRSTC